MKKFFLLSTLAASSFSVFAEGPAQNTQPTQTQPKIIVSVYDLSNKVARDTQSRTLSRSNNNLKLCWTVFDMPLKTKSAVTEIFTSPKGGNFSASDMQIISNKEKTEHKVTKTDYATNNAEYVQSCWEFTDKDPIGEYSIKVKVDEAEFPAVPFTLTK